MPVKSAIDATAREQALRELEGLSSKGMSADLVCHKAASVAMEMLCASGATVTRCEGDDLVYVVGLGAARQLTGKRTPIVMSFTGVVMLSRQPRVFVPDQAPPASRHRARDAGFSSGIVIPILDGNRPIGTLGLTSDAPDAFGDDDAPTLRRVTRLLAAAITEPSQAQRSSARAAETRS